MTNLQRRLTKVAGTALGLFITVRFLCGFLADRWWFNDIGFGSVWRGVIGTQLVLAGLGAVVFFALCFGSLTFVNRSRSDGHLTLAPVQLRAMTFSPEKRILAEVTISALLALAMGVALSAHWDAWLRFRHGGQFGGATDPLYHHDASFYVFKLPFIEAVSNWLFVATFLLLVISMLAHFLGAGIVVTPGAIRVSDRTRAHGLVFLALLAGLKAIGYAIQRYDLVASHFGVTDGASYTDVTVRRPALSLMIFVAIATGVVLLASIRRAGFLVPGVAMALWAVLAVGLLVAMPRLIQSVAVRPNELQKERTYIQRNIDATLRSYRLDTLQETNVDPTKTKLETAVDSSPDTISRIRLWDTAVAGQAMEALANRVFFSLRQADVDRVDGKPVIIAPRQLVPSKLERGSWVNRTLQYTHGYSVRIADGASSSGDGSLVQQKGLPTGRMYIQDGLGGYAILGSGTNEIDDGSIVRKGAATFGVPVGSLFRRIVLAFNFGDPNLVISGQIKPTSRALWVRDVRARAHKAAPFLRFDSDPYPVIVGNKTVWVLDGYTATSRFPYAQSAPITRLIDLNAVSPDSGLAGGFNYARNSVKAIIGADDGSVKLYATDSKDPILRVYTKAFPKLFRPAIELGVLGDHLRYPADLYAVQAEMYGVYHARKPEAVQSRSNIWPTSPDPGTGLIENDTAKQNTVPLPASDTAMAPQYLMLDKDHLTIAQYLVSGTGKDTNRPLIAIVTGRVDRLGQPTLGAQVMRADVPGPTQVGATFEQETGLSGTITLLSSAGSQVVRGALQVLPLKGDALLYVRTIYVAAAKNSFPQLKYVAVSDGQHAAYASTLSAALNKLFNRRAPSLAVAGPTSSAGAPVTPSGSGGALLDGLQQAYDQAQAALRKGDLATYQAKVDEMGNLVAQARREVSSPGGSGLAPGQTAAVVSGSAPSSVPGPDVPVVPASIVPASSTEAASSTVPAPSTTSVAAARP